MTARYPADPNDPYPGGDPPEPTVEDITDDLLASALRFYKESPDGQYDHDVVVPLIKAEIERRIKQKAAWESSWPWNTGILI